MITQELKDLLPVLDPLRRWCDGKGKPAFVVRVGTVRAGKFTPHPSLEHSGGGIRLCAACAKACVEQAKGRHLVVDLIEIEKSVLTGACL